jgi:serine/threonine protein kinase
MVAHAGGQGSLMGATIGGYEVVALIGRGAMGAVYLARDVKLNRLVALKVLLGSLAKSPTLVKQFYQEAQASAPLNHPSIVRVYSAGIEDGTPYIAMEYVEGEPLDRSLKRKGRMKWDVALHIGYKLAQGLEHAHNAGIVHRDIKPSNIMLDKHGGMRLADFGIAKIQSDGASSDGDSFLGTPQYMSPEQATNGNIGPSSDIYSLGVTLHQMISGELPFIGESSIALINSICNDEPPRLNKKNDEIPDDVARFVAYLLEKSPQNRPANAKVVYSMMQRLMRQKGESSSLSDGLSEFIQGEMEIRAFQSLTEKSTTSINKKVKPSSNTSDSSRVDFKRVISLVLRVAIVSIIAIASFWLPTLTQGQATVDLALSIPVKNELEYIELSESIDLYQLSSNAYSFSNVRWIGDESVVWLEVSGHDGMITHQDIGVMGIDVDSHSSMTLDPLKGPVTNPTSDLVYASSMKSGGCGGSGFFSLPIKSFLICRNGGANW